MQKKLLTKYIPKVNKFSWELEFADFLGFVEIREIKFPQSFSKWTVHEIKLPRNFTESGNHEIKYP